MEVLRDETTCPHPPEGTAVTIGAYDGVHLGHRVVIDRVRKVARKRGLRTAVVTFDRHPASVVRPDSAPLLLTDLDQKLELLASTGVDFTLVVHFDEARSKEPAEEFVAEVLVDCLNVRAVVVGEDFHFGHQRRGNVSLLRAMGEELANDDHDQMPGPEARPAPDHLLSHGFEVLGLDLVDVDGSAARVGPPVSSTRVRAALRGGRIGEANEMLGRLHEVRGTVERGDSRGREIGFPTANIDVPEGICLPADGIYSGWYVTPDRCEHAAALSLGRRPTFSDDQPFSLLEAHLLDGEHDLYDQPAVVRFASRLRDELKFDSVSSLVDQIERDCIQARDDLGCT